MDHFSDENQIFRFENLILIKSEPYQVEAFWLAPYEPSIPSHCTPSPYERSFLRFEVF